MQGHRIDSTSGRKKPWMDPFESQKKLTTCLFADSLSFYGPKTHFATKSTDPWHKDPPITIMHPEAHSTEISVVAVLSA